MLCYEEEFKKKLVERSHLTVLEKICFRSQRYGPGCLIRLICLQVQKMELLDRDNYMYLID